MVGYSSLHGGGDAERLMHPTEVIVHEIQGHSVTVIVDLLAESVRQPRESSHGHAHREILPLHE